MDKTIWIPDTWDDCQYNSECECDLRDAVCSDETADENDGLPYFCPLRIIRDWVD